MNDRTGRALRSVVPPAPPWPRDSMPKRVALVYGGGGQNIGNAFYYEGGKWILEQVFGEGTVGFVQTQPAYWTFSDQREGNPVNSFPFLASLDVDYLVLQGPLFTRHFRDIWESTLRAMRKRGTQLILLGTAFHRYDEEEAAIARPYLQALEPLAVVTRDEVTYRRIAPWGLNCHNGVDSALAVVHAYRPPVVRLGRQYIVMTFDRYPEPNLSLVNAASPASPAPGSREGRFEFGGHNWHYRQPMLSSWFSERGKWQAYLGAMLDRRRLPSSLGRFAIVRPDHRYNPHISWKIYQGPNGVVSDEPFTYCAVYAGSALTLSDRVHACVATLAYEKPAMLFTESPRAHLFDRIGLPNIRRWPVALSANLRDDLLFEEVEFLRKSVL
jgi:hypothetical protein